MKIDLFRVMHDGNMFYLKTSLVCLQFDWLMFEWKEFQTENTSDQVFVSVSSHFSRYW